MEPNERRSSRPWPDSSDANAGKGSVDTEFLYSGGAHTDRPSLSGFDNFEDSTLDPAHPRQLNDPIVALSGKAYKQLLGLNPFKTSYISLYGSLKTGNEKLVAVTGVLFAIAAGIPLPLIGVIFGRLISTFPPSEDELRTRISQLLGVAAAFFVVTSIYATSFGFTGEKIAIRTRERLLDCLLHLDLAYLDTHDVDINSLLSEKVDSIHAGCSEKAGIFIQSISYFVAAFTVGFILSPKLTGILLAAVIPTLCIVTVLTRWYGSKYSKKVTTLGESATNLVENALRSIKTVQAFSMMDSLHTEHAQILEMRIGASAKKAIVAALQVGSIYFLAYAINALAFYVGSQLVASGRSGGDAGTVFAVVLLILDSSMVVAQFAPFLEIFAQAAAAQESIRVLLDAYQVPSSSGDTPDLRELPIQISNVDFAYPGELQYVNDGFEEGTLTSGNSTSNCESA
jgi:ATP-binding cassette, subfamily B (MDR/TAP), member 1